MVRIQKRITIGLEVLQYFTTREWWFDTDNFKSLAAKLNLTDKELYPMDLTIIEDEPYIESCMIGGKLYCLKEKLENLPKARLQNNILYVVDRVVSVMFYLFVLSYIVAYFPPVKELLKLAGPIVGYLPFVGKTVFDE